jgi:hypothetical protein
MAVKIRLIREVRGVEVPLGRISDPTIVDAAVRWLMQTVKGEKYTDPFQAAAAEIERRRLLDHLAMEGYLPDDNGEGGDEGE